MRGWTEYAASATEGMAGSFSAGPSKTNACGTLHSRRAQRQCDDRELVATKTLPRKASKAPAVWRQDAHCDPNPQLNAHSIEGIERVVSWHRRQACRWERNALASMRLSLSWQTALVQEMRAKSQQSPCDDSLVNTETKPRKQHSEARAMLHPACAEAFVALRKRQRLLSLDAPRHHYVRLAE